MLQSHICEYATITWAPLPINWSAFLLPEPLLKRDGHICPESVTCAISASSAAQLAADMVDNGGLADIERAVRTITCGSWRLAQLDYEAKQQIHAASKAYLLKRSGLRTLAYLRLSSRQGMRNQGVARRRRKTHVV